MTVLDTTTAAVIAGPAHPAWCDRTRCTVQDDLPLDDGVHYSRTVRLDAALTLAGLITAEVALQQDAGRDDVHLAVTIPLTGASALFPIAAATHAVDTIADLLNLAGPPPSGGLTYTHPDVLDVGVREGWADPETDPTKIDWAPRQATAMIPFQVVDGRPVNPVEQTPIRYGRGELGHWGEGVAADALVTAIDTTGALWVLMVERSDGHGWALPGGMVEPGEDPAAAAVRELIEETGFDLGNTTLRTLTPRYVPDPRGTDEAWMVTVVSRADLGVYPAGRLPVVAGADDAAQAAWIRADDMQALIADVVDIHDGQVFDAHRDLLADLLGDRQLLADERAPGGAR